MAFPLMKHLTIIALWMSLLFAPMSSALHIDESVNEVLLGVDCEGQLRLPLVDSRFNLSENLLRALWDAKDLLLDFSSCDYLDNNCSSNFLFKIENEEVFSIQAHLMRCPNKTRPAMSIVCVGDACSKLMIPCETPNDCGTYLTCPRKHPFAKSSYFSQLTSEMVSKILYPQHRPTNEWQFCGLTTDVSITRSHRQLPEKLEQISSGSRHVGSTKNDAENSTSDTKIFQLSCQGEMGLFGRQHFIGIIPRAVHIIQGLPVEAFGFNSDFNFIRYWIEYAGFTVLPLEEFTSMINILGLNITTGHNQRGKKWIVHSRGINETLTIEVNSCATEHDSLVTIAVTRGLYDLLSVRSCAQHMDCPSAMCFPIREKRGLRTLLLVNEPHNGVCVPLVRPNSIHPFDPKELLEELFRILYRMNTPKYQRYNADELVKNGNKDVLQEQLRLLTDPYMFIGLQLLLCLPLLCCCLLEKVCGTLAECVKEHPDFSTCFFISIIIAWKVYGFFM